MMQPDLFQTLPAHAATSPALSLSAGRHDHEAMTPEPRRDARSGKEFSTTAARSAPRRDETGNSPCPGDGRGRRDTSREAYRELFDTDKLNKSQKWLLTWLHGRNTHRVYDWTRAELVQATGWTSGAICARVFELVRDGWLIEQPRRECTVTKKSAHSVRLA